METINGHYYQYKKCTCTKLDRNAWFWLWSFVRIFRRKVSQACMLHFVYFQPAGFLEKDVDCLIIVFSFKYIRCILGFWLEVITCSWIMIVSFQGHVSDRPIPQQDSNCERWNELQNDAKCRCFSYPPSHAPQDVLKAPWRLWAGQSWSVHYQIMRLSSNSASLTSINRNTKALRRKAFLMVQYSPITAPFCEDYAPLILENGLDPTCGHLTKGTWLGGAKCWRLHKKISKLDWVMVHEGVDLRSKKFCSAGIAEKAHSYAAKGPGLDGKIDEK